MEGAPKDCVLITGISGYVGSQVCKYFLENGSFKVKGTVRDTKRAEKIEPLKKAFGNHFDQLELVEADLNDEASIQNAMAGCKYVVHTASPFPLAKPKHENDLIQPAVNGTLAAMKGCQMHGVKRIVITSSIVAISKPTDTKKTDFTRDDWTDVNLKSVGAYEKSKTLAEQAAWDFLKGLPENERFEVVVINPGLVLGPNLNKANFTSGDIIKKVMLGEIPCTPSMQLPMVDVRDVAQAHLNAILRPEANGQRFMLVGHCIWFTDMGVALFNKYGKDYPKCAHKPLPRIIARIGSIFSNEMKMMNANWGKSSTFENKETKDVLGIEFHEWNDTVMDMVETLIETEYIPDKRGSA